MEIDNPRKRCRDEVPDCDHVAKKARQSDADASARDDSTPSTPGESTASTPASTNSMEMEMEMHDAFQLQAPEPKPQPQVRPPPPPRTQSTIIAGWNQSRRNHYLNQGYPLHWMQNSAQVSGCCSLLIYRGYIS